MIIVCICRLPGLLCATIILGGAAVVAPAIFWAQEPS